MRVTRKTEIQPINGTPFKRVFWSMGQAMAEYLATGNAEALPLPLQPVRPLPFHALNKMYFAAAVAWYRFLDRRGSRSV